ncbi:MAG: hypothetical protein H6Q92_1995, partial [Nitrospirae bacterium]|nr:hypothetical protein [Nitrospirota bacterium]
MINPTKKRLTRIFTAVALSFSVLILSISYFFVHYSSFNEMKRHLNEDIETEFLEQFYHSGLEPFKNIWHEHRFQILNRDGEVKNETYLVAYFPIDGKYVGRAAISLTEAKKYQSVFLKLILITLPGIFLISFFVSRYLVNQAMDQISDFFTFQETFSSNVTHELRSPLASLKGNLEVTLRKDRGTEEYKDILNLSLKEVDRIINLLNNLNLLASSKFKPLDLFKDSADISKVIDELLKTYSPVLQAKKINFDVAK